MPASSVANTSRTRDRSRALSRISPQRRADPYKRLIVAEDGTWLNMDSEDVKGSLNVPSNVTRISRAIRPQSSDGIQQIVYYHKGVGASAGLIDKVYGGITGEGLAENVREGYDFIATNYEHGDELFFFGFSRGAFTARAIAGLIGEVGVLTKKGMPYLAEIFRDVQHRHDPNYKPKHPDLPFRNKPSALDPRYGAELARRGLTVLDVPIKAIGVWDTVGSLGTPRIGWLEKIGIQSSNKEMSFYDTRLSDCIQNAFQALGLDERRSSFSPALWEKMPGNTTRLRQVWFPGVHSNVGGGYDDQELANLTLAWMMSQVRPFLDMDLDYLLDQQDETDRYYERSNQRIRPWSFGKILDSMNGIYALGGATTRSPGRYYRIDADTGRQTETPLRDTCEYIHPSVRTRLKLKGPGVDDKGVYECRALEDWKLVVDYPENSEFFDEYDDEKHAKRPPPRTLDVFWKLRTSQTNVTTRVIPESPLWPLERELLELDPDFEDFALNPGATVKQRSNKGTSRRTYSTKGSRSRR